MRVGLQDYDPKRFPGFEVVAYHDNCTDGLAAAAVVAQFAIKNSLIMPEFVPVQYGNPLPERISEGSRLGCLSRRGNLLFVDFCPELDQVDRLEFGWNDWVAIDHHNHREWLPVAYPDNAVFDLDQSGAVLTWDWLEHPCSLPIMLAYVQDRDLWKWELPYSREISAALAEEPRTVADWTRLIKTDPMTLLSAGKVLIKSRTRAASSQAKKAFLVGSSNRGDFMAVNATENLSEVGEEILKRFPDAEVACSFFLADRQTVVLSFRSQAKFEPSFSTALGMARHFNGGGHEHAAGAKVTLEFWAKYLETYARA